MFLQRMYKLSKEHTAWCYHSPHQCLKWAGTSYYSFLLPNLYLASQFPSHNKCPFRSQLHRADCTWHELNGNVINIKATTTVNALGQFQTIPDPMSHSYQKKWKGGRHRPDLLQWSEVNKSGLCEKEIYRTYTYKRRSYNIYRKQGSTEYLYCRLQFFASVPTGESLIHFWRQQQGRQAVCAIITGSGATEAGRSKTCRQLVIK